MINSSIENGILHLSLNRPEKLNAMSADMYGHLAAAIANAQKDTSVRCIYIRAEGDSFCSGNDMADFLKVAQGGFDGNVGDFPPVQLLFSLADNELPIVVSVKGLAVGIGLTLLLHCDLVVLGESAKLKAPFTDLGLVPEAASSMLLPPLVGRVATAEILLLGASIDAQRALQLGLCNRVVADEVADATALEMAVAMAKKPAEAVRLSRAMIAPNGEKVKAVMQQELKVFMQRLQSDEARAAFQAFFARG